MVMKEGSFRPEIKVIKKDSRLEQPAAITETPKSAERRMTMAATEQLKAAQAEIKLRKQKDSELLEQWRAKAA